MRNFAWESEPTTGCVNRDWDRRACGEQDQARPPFVDPEPAAVRRLLAAAADGSAVVAKVHAESRCRAIACGAES
jgi:hypothetical protein